MASIEDLRQEKEAIMEMAVREKVAMDSKLDLLKQGKLRDKYDTLG